MYVGWVCTIAGAHLPQHTRGREWTTPSAAPPPPPTLLRQGLFVVHCYVCQARWPVSFEDSPVSHLTGRSPGVANMLHHIEPYWGFKLRFSHLHKDSTHVVIFIALIVSR